MKIFFLKKNHHQHVEKIRFTTSLTPNHAIASEMLMQASQAVHASLQHWPAARRSAPLKKAAPVTAQGASEAPCKYLPKVQPTNKLQLSSACQCHNPANHTGGSSSNQSAFSSYVVRTILFFSSGVHYTSIFHNSIAIPIHQLIYLIPFFPPTLVNLRLFDWI